MAVIITNIVSYSVMWQSFEHVRADLARAVCVRSQALYRYKPSCVEEVASYFTVLLKPHLLFLLTRTRTKATVAADCIFLMYATNFNVDDTCFT